MFSTDPGTGSGHMWLLNHYLKCYFSSYVHRLDSKNHDRSQTTSICKAQRERGPTRYRTSSSILNLCDMFRAGPECSRIIHFKRLLYKMSLVSFNTDNEEKIWSDASHQLISSFNTTRFIKTDGQRQNPRLEPFCCIIRNQKHLRNLESTRTDDFQSEVQTRLHIWWHTSVSTPEPWLHETLRKDKKSDKSAPDSVKSGSPHNSSGASQ